MRDQLCTGALIILVVGVTVLAEAASGPDFISEGIDQHDLHLKHNDDDLHLQHSDDELRVDKIIGGRVAADNAHPYMVLVQAKYRNARTGRLEWSVCGGTLINKEWVLTAAHCVDEDPKKNRVRVYLYGGFRLDLPFDIDLPFDNELFAVKSVIRHGLYDDELNYNENDIALLKLMKPVSTGGHRVNTVRLDDDKKRIDRENCVTAGWGITVPRQIGSTSRVLKEARQALISSFECGQRLGSQGQFTGNICATSIINPAGGWGGSPADMDSGGPLMCLVRNTRKYVQVGIVVSGDEDTDLYTKVAAYRSWIRKITRV